MEDVGQLSIDVYQTKKEIIILSPIAGVDLDEVNVVVSDEVLTISGERKFPLKKVDQEDFLTKECFWGKFSRSILLPTNVDASSIDAGFENSILEIRIPKTDDTKTKVIPIKGK
jgi:HSP20 family protein